MPVDSSQYNTLMDALKHLSDPRKSRGKCYSVDVALGCAVIALTSAV